MIARCAFRASRGQTQCGLERTNRRGQSPTGGAVQRFQFQTQTIALGDEALRIRRLHLRFIVIRMMAIRPGRYTGIQVASTV